MTLPEKDREGAPDGHPHQDEYGHDVPNLGNSFNAIENEHSLRNIQSWAIRWALGCVNLRPVARGSQEPEFTQPRAHLIAHLCMYSES